MRRFIPGTAVHVASLKNRKNVVRTYGLCLGATDFTSAQTTCVSRTRLNGFIAVAPQLLRNFRGPACPTK